MAAGIGLTSCVGLPWTNLHLIVPFLVLGIGVDDMFVLLQAFDAVQNDVNCKHLTLQQKAGKALQVCRVFTLTMPKALPAWQP